MDDELIGTSESQQNLQRKYFELIHSSRENPLELIKGIEGDLNGFTFLGESQNLTIADLACFTFLYKHMQSFSNEEKHQHPNVYRWFLYLQELRGVKQFLEERGLPLMSAIDWTQIHSKTKGK